MYMELTSKNKWNINSNIWMYCIFTDGKSMHGFKLAPTKDTGSFHRFGPNLGLNSPSFNFSIYSAVQPIDWGCFHFTEVAPFDGL